MGVCASMLHGPFGKVSPPSNFVVLLPIHLCHMCRTLSIVFQAPRTDDDDTYSDTDLFVANVRTFAMIFRTARDIHVATAKSDDPPKHPR